MNRDDFVKLIGADEDKSEYLPVACLLRSGYGCLGHYNSLVNDGLKDTCVLLNARLIGLSAGDSSNRPAIRDFDEFLEEIVSSTFAAESDHAGDATSSTDAYGRTIPLTAIPLDELAVVYPVAHISRLIKRASEAGRGLPTFFDMDQSEILRVLRTKLW